MVPSIDNWIHVTFPKEKGQNKSALYNLPVSLIFEAVGSSGFIDYYVLSGKALRITMVYVYI